MSSAEFFFEGEAARLRGEGGFSSRLLRLLDVASWPLVAASVVLVALVPPALMLLEALCVRWRE